MNGIRQELESRYRKLFTDYDLEQPLDGKNISVIIKQSLCDFLQNAQRPAVYCNGGHTKMLMADFMYELKKVKYIVDNYAVSEEDNGFILIKDKDIEKEGIDTIVLSTYKFRNDLKESIRKNHPNIPVLDIYDEFEKRGVTVRSDYYYSNHPYHHYKGINQLQRQIKSNVECAPGELYEDLVTKYLHIKDFHTAIIKLQEWKVQEDKRQTEDKDEHSTKIERMLFDVEALYELQKRAAASLPGSHVLMFCMDGLRQQDLSERDMPKLNKFLDETAYRFTNAYSFSTSTFEGLVPVYSENGDLRTKYYEKNSVAIEDCRFASLAKEQNREIYVYGDAEHYIEGKSIHYSEQFLTVTEKLWQFILDGCETEKGLFYLHELYESHFTFSNPYTEAPLRSEGTAMLFDFLPMKGGKLRADYAKQHEDAVHYLDDVLEPLLRPMKCRMVLYADHGNLVLDQKTKLSEIGDMEYTCSQGWTRIPLAICSPEMETGSDSRLISLMELNKIVINLLKEDKYDAPDVEYIKLARSELYNPDFRYLYDMIGRAKYLQAFECFVFGNGRKLIVFADGSIEVYDTEDRPVQDIDIREIVEGIKKEITVCAMF